MDFSWKLMRVCTTSPKRLVGKPVTFWTCAPKPVLGTEWLRINHRAAGKPEFLQLASHLYPSATTKLGHAELRIWTFLHHFGVDFLPKRLFQGKTASTCSNAGADR